MTGLLLATVVAAPVTAANPTNPGRDELLLAHCIREAAEGRVWLERTLWGLRDQEGGWRGAEVPNRNGSHDLGPLQVNSWWVGVIATKSGRPSSVIRTWLRDDICFNVRAARWIFLSELAASGDYWRAIGAYHSPMRIRRQRYATSVADHLKRRFGETIFGSARRAN